MTERGPRLRSSDVPAANPVEASIRRFDDFQRRHPLLALPIGVIRKYADDNGGILAALLTYYAFLSIFPFLLLAVTVLGFFLGEPDARSQLATFLSEFPVVGERLVENIQAIQARGLGLALGLIGTTWGSLGVLQAAQYAMAEIGDSPRVDRPNPFRRLGRSLFLTLAGLGTLLVVVWLIGRGMSAPRLDVSTAGEFLISVALTTAVIAFGYRVLAPGEPTFSRLWRGALTAGIAWTMLVGIGTYLATNQLRRASDLYGFFGVIIGLVAWMALASNFFVIGAEVNIVRERRLWPRTLLQPPIVDADETVLTSQVMKERRRPEQQISVEYSEPQRTEGRGDDEGRPNDIA